MFHPTALYSPMTGAERIRADIAHVREMLTDPRLTGSRKAYYAGRSRTRAEWLAFITFHETRLEA